MSVKPLDLQVNIQNTLEVARLESFKMGKEVNDARSAETKNVRQHIHDNQDIPITGETEIMTELSDRFDTYDEEKHVKPENRQKNSRQKNEDQKQESQPENEKAEDSKPKDGHIDYLA